MSNYYNMRDGKVRIAHELMNRGWKVYGYKEDKSDSMTDYYSPANWTGIAEKNGYILVVDNSHASESQEIKKYNPKGNLSFEDREKIVKLEQMTTDRGATAGEEENAKELIKKIQSRITEYAAYEVIGIIPAHMANPGKCKWHIEKDGKLYDKGTGITKYANMPESWEFDLATMQYKKGYDTWSGGEKKTITDKQRKIINDFKNLILRFERVVNSMNSCGDGTTETEKAGLEQQGKAGYEKVIEKVIKNVIKPVQKDNININVNDVLSFVYHGHYWIVTDIYTNSKEQKCITYELLGSEKRGYQRLSGTSLRGKRYYQLESRLIKELEEGKTKIYTLQEVEEVTEIERWIKIDKTKQEKYPKKPEQTKTVEQKQEKQTNAKQPEQQKESIEQNPVIIPYKYTITADTDTRDNSPLWVLKIIDKLSREEYIRVSQKLKTVKGFYSKFKHGFIFRYDPTEALKNNSKWEQPIKTKTEEEIRAEQQAEKTALLEKIDKSIATLQDKITALSGNYKTNTYKRMQEQSNRNSKINSYEIDIKLLEHVKSKLADNQPVTELEKGLTVAAFRDNIHSYYMVKYGKYPREIKFPVYDSNLSADSWYNKELPKMQKKLTRYNINNTTELIKAVEEYKTIYDSVRGYVNPIKQKIKQLESEYKLRQKGDINFTPTEVAEEMIRLAKINNNSKVLEPSAGIGNIADKIKEVTEYIDVIEYNYSFVELLKMKGYNVVANDFLDYNRTDYYDVILMNPPFSNNQDITHLQHAYRLLKAGGTLVCITSPHWTFANDRTSQEFRQWIEQQEYFTQDLPSGTFEMTKIKSQIVVIEKNEESLEDVI